MNLSLKSAPLLGLMAVIFGAISPTVVAQERPQDVVIPRCGNDFKDKDFSKFFECSRRYEAAKAKLKDLREAPYRALADDLANEISHLYPDPLEAKKAIMAHGVGELIKVGADIYPPIDIEHFLSDAMERVYEIKDKYHDIAPDILSYVILDHLIGDAVRAEVSSFSLNGQSLSETLSVSPKLEQEQEDGAEPYLSKFISNDGHPILAVKLPSLFMTEIGIEQPIGFNDIRLQLNDKTLNVVVDLRGNEGGSLDNVLLFTGLFLDKDTPVFELETAQKDAKTYKTKHRYNGDPYEPEFSDVRILIDQKTNSGALLSAVFLQEQNIAKIYGEMSPNIKGSAYGSKLISACSLVAPKDKFSQSCSFKYPAGLLKTISGHYLSDGLIPDGPISDDDIDYIKRSKP